MSITWWTKCAKKWVRWTHTPYTAGIRRDDDDDDEEEEIMRESEWK